VKQDVLPFCELDEHAGCFTLPGVARMKSARVIVATCGAAGILRECCQALLAAQTEDLHFTHVMIDEAGQVRGHSGSTLLKGPCITLP
jgi:hypothetical protein